jgi:FdhE protein
MTQDVWLMRHPYLRPVARFHAQVETAAADLSTVLAGVPDWRDYERDFHSGVPLLRSSRSTIELRPVEINIRSLIVKLASTELPNKLAEEIRDLRAELPEGQRGIVAWLLNSEPSASKHVGMRRYLGWTMMALYLSRVVDAFGRWREEERWLRRYCPTCASLPAMAQLVGVDPGRLRLLSCGCCGTRWRYRRTGCPFCENEDRHRFAILAVEAQEGLRIDYCESCGGYIKTYDGTGSEAVLLADWTSLHLDIMARDRGWKRLAASLYEL